MYGTSYITILHLQFSLLDIVIASLLTSKFITIYTLNPNVDSIITVLLKCGITSCVCLPVPKLVKLDNNNNKLHFIQVYSCIKLLLLIQSTCTDNS